MAIKSSIFVACSLDGYIARPNGSLDWLEKANATIPSGIDLGYSAFMQSIDCIVMGRNTFQKILGFEYWPYEEKRVIVLSHNPVSIPPKLPKNISLSSLSPDLLLEKLEKEGVKRVYVDGAKTIQGFIQSGQINDITLTIIPIILGDGIPLFSRLDAEINLKHNRTQTYDFGFVQLTYELNSSPSPTKSR